MFSDRTIKSAGFSLLEVLVAVSLLSLVAVELAYWQLSTVLAAKQQLWQTVALQQLANAAAVQCDQQFRLSSWQQDNAQYLPLGISGNIGQQWWLSWHGSDGGWQCSAQPQLHRHCLQVMIPSC